MKVAGLQEGYNDTRHDMHHIAARIDSIKEGVMHFRILLITQVKRKLVTTT